MPNIKLTLKELPKTFKILQKWQNFVKSGHTGGYRSTIIFVGTNVADITYILSYLPRQTTDVTILGVELSD